MDIPCTLDVWFSCEKYSLSFTDTLTYCKVHWEQTTTLWCICNDYSNGTPYLINIVKLQKDTDTFADPSALYLYNSISDTIKLLVTTTTIWSVIYSELEPAVLCLRTCMYLECTQDKLVVTSLLTIACVIIQLNVQPWCPIRSDHQTYIVYGLKLFRNILIRTSMFNT